MAFCKLLVIFSIILLITKYNDKNAPKFSEFGYWKDYQNIYKYSFYSEDEYPVVKLRKAIIKLYSDQIKIDLDSLHKNKIQNISLCAKWILKKINHLTESIKSIKK